MAIIGSLAVALGLDGKKFEKGLKKSRRSLRRFAKDIPFANTSVLKFGTALVAGAAGGLALMTRQSLKAIDQIGKLSDELGISTEDLIGFQEAARLSGTSNEVLTKGFQRLIRRIGEANLGYGEGVKGLDALGLKAEDLSQIPAAEAMRKIAGAISKLPSAADRAGVAFALFGRQGQDLMNFLLMGEDGLRNVQTEAEALGITFDRISAAKVEEANDSIGRLTLQAQGFANKIAVAVAPYIDFASDKMVELGKSGALSFKQVGKGVQYVIQWVGKLMDWFELSKGVFLTVVGAIQKALGGLLKTWSIAIDTLLKGLEKLPIIGKKIEKLNFRMGDYAEGFWEAGKGSLEDAREAFDRFAENYHEKRITFQAEKILDAAEEAAKKTVELKKVKDPFSIEEVRKRMEAAGGKAGKAFLKAISTFGKDVNLGRVALRVGPLKMNERKVEDPQLKTTNSLLRQIRDKQPVAVTV